jgi:hypothetical protein
VPGKLILGQEVRRNLEEYRVGGGGSLGWSLDGVYIHQVPSKKLLNRKPKELLAGVMGIHLSVDHRFFIPVI